MVHLEDSYYQLFKDRVKVDVTQIHLTFNKPTKVQSLSNGVTLYLRIFDHTHYKYLLASSMLCEGTERFSFCFWLPEVIIKEDIELLEVLRVFANKFGVLLRMGDATGFFFEHAKRLLSDYIQSPHEVAEILCPSIIPVDLFVFYSQNKIGSLNRIDCYYSFAINYNKYLTWLYQIETVEVKVPAIHLDYFVHVVPTLNPVGNTDLLVKDPVSKPSKEMLVTDEIANSNNDEAIVIVPQRYSRVINHINKCIRSLEKGQKLIVIPREKDLACLFCGNTNLSDEHIIPKWSRKFFSRKSFDAITISKAEDEDLVASLNSGVSKGKWDSHGLTVNNVCVTCNNGWLSNLENKAKVLLVKDEKLLDDLDLNSLSTLERKQLARWVIIKCLLLTNKSRLPVNFKESLFQDLKADTISDSLLVELASFKHHNLDFHIVQGGDAIASRFRLDKFDLEIAESYNKDFYQCCFHFGNLIFRVSYWNEKIGLIREGSMKKTKVLYPDTYKLGYFHSKELDELFENTEDKLKIHLFANSLSLTDFKAHS